jgi:hypothetical protein
VRSLLVLQGALLAAVFGLGISALVWPSLLPPVPAPNSGAAMALLVVGVSAYGLLIVRALRTFLLTQRALDLVVVVGLVWLGTAAVPALTMNYSQLGWWVGFEVELDGILLVGLAVAVDLARAAQSRPLAGDLRGADLVAAEDIFLERGYRLLNELGGFSTSVCRLVRDHHERLDGKGYPRGLSTAEIDLDTRILTVCDVYDALISKRVYRAAWSHEDAMALLNRETGTAFDPRCVAALEQVVTAGQVTEPVRVTRLQPAIAS